MSGDDDVMTQAEAARRIGVTRGRLSQCKKMGMPVLEDGMVSLSAVRRWMGDTLNPMRRKAPPAPVAPPRAPAPQPPPEKPTMNRAAIEVLKSHLGFALFDIQEDVAILSVAAKLRMEQAFALSGAITYHVWGKVEDQLRKAGVLGPEEELLMPIEPPEFWEHLAQRSGEPYDLAAWQAFSRWQFGDAEPDDVR